MMRAPPLRNGLVRGGLSHWMPDDRIPLKTGSVGELLEMWAQRQGDRTAVFWEDEGGLRRFSYRELWDSARQVAAWLLERVAAGDHVATWTANVLEFVILEYACALSGIILAPFNTGWAENEILHGLRLVDPKILFVGNDNRGQSLLARAQRLGGTTDILPIEMLQRLSPSGVRPLPQVDGSSKLLIQFTSGTTGLAKGAMLTQSAMLNSAWMRPFIEGADANDVWLNSVPYHHVGGSVLVILGALTVGGAFVVMRAHDAATILRLIGTVRATRLGGVPTMFHDIVSRPDAPPHGQVKVVTLGGAMVSADLVRQVMATLGGAVTISFAQSECPIITATHPDDPPELIATTVGRPAPHVEMKIVDPDSRVTLPLGAVGEICVKAPYVMAHYYDIDGNDRAAFDDEGYLHTGDLGSFDEGGFCRLRGRARELIIRGGENVYPVEVELALARHPSVAAAAVIGLDHPRLGQEVAAVVVLREGMAVTTDELALFLRDYVAHFKVPRHWIFTETFSLTASGKIRKTDLELLFDQENRVNI